MRLASAALALLLLVGCGNPPQASTPAPPASSNSAQTQVLNADRLLADSINGSVRAAILLRNQGKIDAASVTLIEGWAKSAVAVDDSIATELASADPWATQKVKILAMLPSLKVPAVSGLDPVLATDFATITAIIAQIQAQVK